MNLYLFWGLVLFGWAVKPESGMPLNILESIAILIAAALIASSLT